jgi:hypothetical protein
MTQKPFCPKSIFRKIPVLILLLFFLAFFQTYAQAQQKHELGFENTNLSEAFDRIESLYGVRFSYNPDSIPAKTFSLSKEERTLKELLSDLESMAGLEFFEAGNNMIGVQPKSKNQIEISQDTYKVSGIIQDENNNPLMGANVYIEELNIGAVTDEKGAFLLSVPQGNYTLSISYLGFSDIEKPIKVNGDLHESYSMQSSNQSLEEVIIVGNNNAAEIKKPEMSVNSLSTEEIKQVPVVLGEPDPMKVLLKLPGVTSGGEGSSGFNVRGGASDQNLILLDNAPVFNSSHLFGFFSIFNADAIEGLKLYKGGIPAEFGGRVSSVLDVKQKTGDYQNFHMNGGIGLISSRLLAEGPIEKGKGAFLLAGRSSYAHLFLKLANNDNSAQFYDLNTKLSYQLNPNNNLYFSGYFGRDVFSIGDSFSSSYGNTMGSLHWEHDFSENLNSDLYLIYSEYLFDLDLDIQDFLWENSLKNYALKYNFEHKLSDKIGLNYGMEATYYDFNPGTLKPSGADSGINFRQLDKKYALEPAFYIGAEHELSDKLSIRYGVRYSMFYRLGEQNISTYENNQAVVFNPDLKIYEEGIPNGEKSYGSGETIASFDNLEPRFAVSYMLNEDASIKASYNRMSQYIHLISNTQSPTPLNIWAPSGPFIKPQLLDQVALGYFRNFDNGAYSLETEVFYKKVENRLDYVAGADIIANNNIERIILNGEARSYGWEVLFRKNTGKLTGWVAYTLSRAEQRTPGRTPMETGINNGDWYLSPYDKLHNLAITATYELNKKWTFGANFTLQTGQPVTYPNGYYKLDEIWVPHYGPRNENRLPMYHHLDISATFTPNPDKKKGWRGQWVFGIYNVYNRMNTASLDFEPNETTGVNEAVRLSIFGIIPSISYNFKF